MSAPIAFPSLEIRKASLLRNFCNETMNERDKASMVPQTATNTPYCDTARAASPGFPGFCPNIRGNLARNSILGPGLADLDFSLVKNNYITERFNLQLRVEAFNALNRANFAQLTLNANTGGGLEAIFANGEPNPQFGQITATQFPTRQIQLALKLVW
jgi:hypothetical protein